MAASVRTVGRPPQPVVHASRRPRQPCLKLGIEVLSPRERQVLQCRADGFMFKELAPALGISIPTAKTHAARAFDKLGVRSSLQAIRLLFVPR